MSNPDTRSDWVKSVARTFKETATMALETIQAPFTDEQVDALNRYQTQSDLHEFTCGNNERHTDASAPLVATREGWICSDPECGYTQNWAHAFMAS